MTPSRFRRIALVAWVFQALIVLSGAAVRLTEAGLGCEDWPSCTEDRAIPEWELHGWIEFGNRLISLVVVVSTIAAVVGAYRRRPRRQDLIGLAWGLVAGTAAQVVLGGVTVLLDLHPIVVSVHFLLSMVLLVTAQLLWVRAGPPPTGELGGDRTISRLSLTQMVVATLVLLTGTVVTGTGPNSGDTRADRLDFELTSVARVHSTMVWLLIATVVVLIVLLARSGRTRHGPGTSGFRAAQLLALAVVAQGAVGYTQFALGVPPLLVELHMLGAVVVWTLSIMLRLELDGSTWAEPDRPEVTTAGEPITKVGSGRTL